MVMRSWHDKGNDSIQRCRVDGTTMAQSWGDHEVISRHDGVGRWRMVGFVDD